MAAALSIIIKTFQRPDALSRLLVSIREQKLSYPILVADDGEQSVKELLENNFADLPITYLRLPFDTGLSEGRNALLRAVRTPYFVLCDDDYAFDERADFEKALNIAKEQHIDVLGGAYYNYVNIPSLKVLIRQWNHPLRLKRFFLNQFKVSRYIGNFYIEGTRCELRISNTEPQNDVEPCDLVNNFFIGHTERILHMGGWDKQLKMGEHEDFFLRVRQQGLRVCFLRGFGTRHYPAIPVKNNLYAAYRKRAADFKKLFAQKHGFHSYLEKEVESGKTLFTLDIK